MTEPFLRLIVFVVLMVATPGPANLLVMIGGARLGLRGCIGFILGLVSGKLFLNLAFGVGLGVLLTGQPTFLAVIKYAGAAYMAWLTLQSWNAATSVDVDSGHFRFRHGVPVHPLNPKAWVMTVLAWTQFAPDLGSFSVQLVVVPLCFAVCQILFHSLWCWLGEKMAKALPNSLLLTRCLVLLTLGVVIWALLQ